MNTTTEELASLYVLDKLDPGQKLAFEARLQADADLLQLVRDLESALEDQIRALPQHEAPTASFEHIISRIHPGEPLPLQQKVVSIPWISLVGWGMAAILILGLGLTFFLTSGRLPPPSGSNSVVLVVGMDAQSNQWKTITLDGAADASESFTQLAVLAEELWKNPDHLPGHTKEPNPTNTRSSGYTVFNPASKNGFIAIQQLPRPVAGKQYYLWVKDPFSNRLECAGLIPLRDANHGLYSFVLPRNSNITSDRVVFFITEESSADPTTTRPRGRPVLGSDHI